MDKFDPDMLWFDVEIGYYTTNQIYRTTCNRLWFDVEIGYYTTPTAEGAEPEGCDLM